MTIEDFRKLKTGDKVIVWKVIYKVSVGWNHYRIPFVVFLNECRSVYRIYDIESCGIISVYENDNNFPESFAYNEFRFLNDMEHYDEKKWLEIQLKEAEELVQKETARVDSIKAKIEELSKPKLKIGGLYRFKFSERRLIGVLRSIEDDTYTFVSSGFNNYSFSSKFPKSIENAEFKEITNPKYSHIGPTILEFMKLNPENFQ